MKSGRKTDLVQRKDGYSIRFDAMASPCEVLIETSNQSLALEIGDVVANEVWRIEDKFSRYDINSVCSQINQSEGQSIAIDNETFLLLSFAQQCYQLSDGLFDITSGALRKVWRFDCTDNIPSQKAVRQVMASVGWEKISFDEHQITLPKGMEIDFGGIGKEYAVDKASILVQNKTTSPCLVNLGGDLCATQCQSNGQPWRVGIEHPLASINKFTGKKEMIVSLFQGALATSGDAKKFLLKAGVRYSHILNARTGWPIKQAPRSMTVVAPQCIQAGILATLSLMQGKDAEKFLQDQGVKYWAIR